MKLKRDRKPAKNQTFSITGVNVQGDVMDTVGVVLLAVVAFLLILVLRRQLDFNQIVLQKLVEKID